MEDIANKFGKNVLKAIFFVAGLIILSKYREGFYFPTDKSIGFYSICVIVVACLGLVRDVFLVDK